MNNRQQHQSIIARILDPLRPLLGDHFIRYKNHSARLFELSNHIHCGDLSNDDVKILSIACAFNSLHVWSNDPGTDYEKRVVPLIEFLANQNMIDKANEICHLIGITGKYDQSPFDFCRLEESFRKAYWTDITMGTRTFRLSSSNYKRILKKYPSRGFHWLLRTRTQDLTKTDSRIKGIISK